MKVLLGSTFPILLFSFLFSMPTVDGFGTYSGCFLRRRQLARNDPFLMPTPSTSSEKHNDHFDEAADQKNNEAVKIDYGLRPSSSNKNVKLDVDVNINLKKLGKH